MAAETVELGTIYLVDLVGSAQMATSVGPVRWDEMREQFFAVLREVLGVVGAARSGAPDGDGSVAVAGGAADRSAGRLHRTRDRA